MRHARFAEAEDELEWWFAGGESEMGFHGQSYEPRTSGGIVDFAAPLVQPRRMKVDAMFKERMSSVEKLDAANYTRAKLVYTPHRWPIDLHKAFQPKRRHDIKKHYTLVGLVLQAPLAISARDSAQVRAVRWAAKNRMPEPTCPTVAEFLLRSLHNDTLKRVVLRWAEDERDIALLAYDRLRMDRAS